MNKEVHDGGTPTESRQSSMILPAGISAEAVRVHLGQILASPTFSGAPKLSRFLHFTVEQALLGNSDNLKEYVIGTEVFGKAASFDPRTDSIVRVQARRLRARMEDYYANADPKVPLIIEYAAGSYVPGFRDPAEPRTSRIEPRAQLHAVRRFYSPRLAWLAVFALLVVVAMVWQFRRARVSASQAATRATPTFRQITNQPGRESFPSLSPDGATIVYDGHFSAKRDIFYQRVDGANRINLTNSDSFDNQQPAYSPDGKHIAFRSDRDGGGIFIMGATGESVRRVIAGGYHPAWSPDGTEIVYDTDVSEYPENHQGHSQIWRVRIDGSASRMLHGGEAMYPRWSPHGKRIVYWSEEGGRRNIWTMPAGGLTSAPGTAIPVTNDQFTNWNPVWFPDGRWIYFSSNRGGTMNLWRVPVDETTGKLLGALEPVTTPAENSAQVAFSADGALLAYRAVADSQNLQQIPFDPSAGKIAGKPLWITQGLQQAIFPDASPDGTWIAFTSAGKQEDIAVVRLDGSEMRKLTDDVYKDRCPRWSPDGKEIAFYSNRTGRYQIWTVHPDGSGLTQVTDLPGERVYYPLWSSDGKRMAYTIPDDTVYVVETGKHWSAQKPAALPVLSATEHFEAHSWSPDGSKLAGVRKRPDGSLNGVVIYDFRTGTYTRCTDFGRTSNWLGDSRRLLFYDSSGLSLLDTRSGRVRRVFTPEPGYLVQFFGLSADYRSVFVSIGTSEGDIWLMTR
jgi:Tol biopolymer transport system component